MALITEGCETADLRADLRCEMRVIELPKRTQTLLPEVGTSGSLVRSFSNGHAGRVSLPSETCPIVHTFFAFGISGNDSEKSNHG